MIEHKLIEEAVAELTDTEFERLATAYAQVKLPERFRSMVPHGRDGRRLVTRWPDGYARDGDSVVEACNAESTKGLCAHLDKKDLNRVSADPAVKHFVFVAGCANLSKAQVERYTTKFAGKGVQAVFFTKTELIEDLELDDRFFRVRKFAKIKEQREPFKYLEDADIFGDEDVPFDIRPRISEFYAEFVSTPPVYAPPAVDDALDCLRKYGIVYVRARPSIGKTVLSTHVGFRHESETEGVVYYANCATDTQGHQVKADGWRVFDEFGVPGTLFILDNAHRDMDFVRGVVLRWRRVGKDRGIRLMLIGWPENDEDVGRAGLEPDPLAFLHNFGAVIDLTIGDDDLRGIYRRLALRREADVEPPPPTEEELETWRRLDGDLVPLSFAIDQRLGQLQNGHRREDGLKILDELAVKAVHNRYLKGLSDDEGNALLYVAALGILDLGVRGKIISHDLLEKAIKRGAVHVVPRGRIDVAKTVHVDYAALILQAAGPRQEQLDLDRLAKLCDRQPELVWPVVRGIRSSERLSQPARSAACARLVKAALAKDPVRLPDNLGLLDDALDHLRDDGGLSAQEVASRVLAQSALLMRAVRSADIGVLELTVENVLERYPPIAHEMIGFLSEREVVADIIRVSALKQTRSFSDFLNSRAPTRVRGPILRWLREPEVAAVAMEGMHSLADGAAFLAALKDDEVDGASVVATALLQRQLQSSADSAIEMMARQLEHVPALAENFKNAVAAVTEGTSEGLAIELAALDLLAARRAFGVLAELVRHAPTLEKIGLAAAHADSNLLARFLRRVPSDLRVAVATAIPTDAWKRAQQEAPILPSDWYRLARCLRDGKRADLGKVSALVSLRAADASVWQELVRHRDSMSIAAFASIAIGQIEGGVPLVQELLETHWNEDWLRAAHRRTRTQGLAASMLALYESNLPKAIVDALSGEHLRTRIDNELRRIPTLEGHELERVVALYGSASLLLGELAVPSAMPSVDVFLDMLEKLRLPQAPRLPYRVAATWIGAKQIVENGLLVFPLPEAARRVYELWRDARPPGERHLIVKHEMVEWLRRELARDPASDLVRRVAQKAAGDKIEDPPRDRFQATE